jgi:hypothetical protein
MVLRCPNGPPRHSAVLLSTDSATKFTENNSQPNHKRTKLWTGVVRDGPVRSNINRTGPTQPQPGSGGSQAIFGLLIGN